MGREQGLAESLETPVKASNRPRYRIELPPSPDRKSVYWETSAQRAIRVAKLYPGAVVWDGGFRLYPRIEGP